MKYKTKIAMATKLTTTARKEIMDDATLYADVCLILGVRAGSLSQLVYRNSTRLTNHQVVVEVAKKMGVKPLDILEQVAIEKKVA